VSGVQVPAPPPLKTAVNKHIQAFISNILFLDNLLKNGKIR
jgi:hypothetical protein